MDTSIGVAARKSATGIEPVESMDPKAALAAVGAKPGPANDDTGADGTPAEHEFDLDHLDGRGRRWSGKFRCHVLTIKERGIVGLTRARLCGGLTPSQIDEITMQIYDMQAWLAVAIDEAPPWAKNLGEYREISVLGAVYKEVLAHEDRFHAPIPAPTGKGKDAGSIEAP